MTGKYQIKFKINNNPTTFLYQLSSPNTVITNQTSKDLLGSGPYQVQSKEKKLAILKKNPFYSGDIKTKNSGILMFTVGDHDIEKNFLQTRPDAAIMYRMVEISSFKDTNYKLIRSNPNITEIFTMNNQRFPFNNSYVRKALATAIYNDFIVKNISGAHKAFGIIPVGIGGSISNLAPNKLPEISPKELFDKVPELKKKSAKVVIHQLYQVSIPSETDQLIEIAKKFNINIKFKYHKNYDDLLPLYLNHELDGFVDLYIYKSREAYNIFEFFTQKGENDANINDPELDELLKEAVSVPSSHGRFQLYRKLNQYIQDNAFVIPLFYMDCGNIMSKCLSGISEDFFFNPYLHLPEISKTKNCHN